MSLNDSTFKDCGGSTLCGYLVQAPGEFLVTRHSLLGKEGQLF